MPTLYQNAYENKSSWSGDQLDCIANAVCCTDASNNDVQFDLNFNATEYIAYIVTPPSVNEFELSIGVASIEDSSGETVLEASMTMQPWQSYPTAAYASSAQVADLTGSVTLMHIQAEVYDIFVTPLPDQNPYYLLQTSLDDEGEHVNKYSMNIQNMLLHFITSLGTTFMPPCHSKFEVSNQCDCQSKLSADVLDV